MSPKLYIYNGSPPCRAALVTAKAVGLTLDIHVINGENNEIRSPEFLKINPQHTVPVLNDDGKIICDSHAIAAYLVGKYGKDESLYPKDLYQRALVDQRMYFNTGVMFPALQSMFSGFRNKVYKEIPKEKIEPVKDIYGILEKFLHGSKWIAGNNVTIADYTCATTTKSLDLVYPIDSKIYPKVDDWLKRVNGLPCFSGDDQQFEHFKKFYYHLSNWE